MEILQKISQKINTNKLNQIINNQYFIEELDLLKSNTVLQYYQHIINNIELNINNINNSYIMWVYDKVNNIDITQPCKTIKGRISPPDIDVDFPRSYRDKVVEYIKQKYGEDKVAKILTFNTMKGRSSISDVLTIHEACSFDEIKQITKFIPDEAKISDDLQEMIEEEGESSIIRWALENNDKELKQWCWINNEGDLEGDLAPFFEQAIRLEGTKRSLGRHACGYVISPKPLKELAPMIKVKGDDEELTLGFDGPTCESIGLIKVDLLAIAALDKLMMYEHMLETQDV